MTECCIWSWNAKIHGNLLQFIRNPSHPDERIYKQIRNPKQIDNPVLLCLLSEDFIQFILQTTLHIEHKEESGSEEINGSKKKPMTVCVFVFHYVISSIDSI